MEKQAEKSGMGKKLWGVATVLCLAVACGRSQKRPGEAGMPIGGVGAGGAPDDTPAEPLGGVAGERTVGDAGARPSGTAGDGEQAAAGDQSDALGGAGGGAGADATSDGGRAGAGGANECTHILDVVLEAPLATTSLTTVAPFEVTLGQGFQGDLFEPKQGQVLSAGCVTGHETNSSLALGAGGVDVLGAGTPKLGAMRSEPPVVASFLDPALVAPFKALLNEDAPRSSWGYAAASIQLWSYFLVQEKRSQVVDCGNGFVRVAAPARAMTVALKLTFPSPDERDLFGRCFTGEDPDITKLADPTPLARFLVQHEAKLAIHVFSAAGPVAKIQQLLDGSQCSTVNLPACSVTLDALAALQSALLDAPEDTVPLANLTTTWGIFDFTPGPYTLFPD
jgi:hypothetical protein